MLVIRTSTRGRYWKNITLQNTNIRLVSCHEEATTLPMKVECRILNCSQQSLCHRRASTPEAGAQHNTRIDWGLHFPRISHDLRRKGASLGEIFIFLASYLSNTYYSTHRFRFFFKLWRLATLSANPNDNCFSEELLNYKLLIE